MDQPGHPLPKSFCILPWVHLATNASGQLRLCCNAQPGHSLIRNEKGNPYQVENITDLKAVWNSSSYKEIRKQMMRGEWPKACSRCQAEESAGVKSARLAWNDHYSADIPEAFSNTREDGEASFKLRYLDLRLGNFCNLKCRMCNPYASRRWLEDWDQVYPALAPNERKRLEKIEWFEDPKAWEILKSALPLCEQMYFTGGEPLLIEKHHLLLRHCIENGYANKITLKYNTNLTVLPKELIEYWPAFKSVRLNCSLDGVGELNDYIRYPSRWETVLKNIENLNSLKSEIKTLRLTFHTTVQSYNFLKIGEILDFVKSWSAFHSLPYLNILDRPEHLNIRNLPDDIKSLAISRIENWMINNASFLESCDPDYVMKLKSLKQYAIAAPMTEEALSEALLQFNKFKKFTNDLDRIRGGLKLQNLVPELGQIL